MTKLSDSLYWQMEGEGLFDAINMESLIPDVTSPVNLLHVLLALYAQGPEIFF